jgi:hypothetical protein
LAARRLATSRPWLPDWWRSQRLTSPELVRCAVLLAETARIQTEEWSGVNSKQIKFLTAIFGAGAVVAMGALVVASNSTSAAEPLIPGPVTTSEVTTGETITETVVPEAPATSAATPDITTTPTSAEPG